MNIEKVLNNEVVRTSIRYAILFPFALISIVLGLYGLVFLIGGITSSNPFSFFLGLSSVAGWVGILGAEKRLLSSSEELTEEEKKKIRIMLTFGFLSSLSLSIWAIATSATSLAIALFFLSLCPLLLIYATPKGTTIWNQEK